MTGLEVDEEIMGATYRALCRHGFAALTMQDIADASEKSKAALHYHYDTKHDLLVAFLEFLLDRFSDRVASVDGANPATELLAVAETVLDPPDAADEREFRTVMLELRAQAPYDAAYQERLTEFDRVIRDRVRETVEEGRAAGFFRDDVEPAETAAFVVTVVSGAQTRRVTLDAAHCPVETARRILRQHVETLLADGEAIGE